MMDNISGILKCTCFQKPIRPYESDQKKDYPRLLHFHPLTIYRYQICKQADTLLVNMLFPHDLSMKQLERNYEYYEPITTHESSLSRAIFSVITARLGRTHEAYDFFMGTALIDLVDLQGNTVDRLHLASMAGAWLSIVYGFAGVHFTKQHLEIQSHLPAEWQGLTFKLKYQGRCLAITLNHNGDTVHLLDGDPLVIQLNGKAVTITE